MANCPLLQKPCTQDQCAWWAVGIKKCVIVGLAVLAEEMHDMGVYAYNKFIKEEKSKS